MCIRDSRLAAVIKGVEDLDFGRFEDNQIDLFGDAYEYLDVYKRQSPDSIGRPQ